MEEDISKGFEIAEKADIKVSTVLIPEYCADKVIKDLKSFSPKHNNINWGNIYDVIGGRK